MYVFHYIALNSCSSYHVHLVCSISLFLHDDIFISGVKPRIKLVCEIIWVSSLLLFLVIKQFLILYLNCLNYLLLDMKLSSPYCILLKFYITIC